MRASSRPGICDTTGLVLGLMPHPERVVEGLLGGTDGLPLFHSLREHFGATTAAGAPAGEAV